MARIGWGYILEQSGNAAICRIYDHNVTTSDITKVRLEYLHRGSMAGELMR